MFSNDNNFFELSFTKQTKKGERDRLKEKVKRKLMNDHDIRMNENEWEQEYYLIYNSYVLEKEYDYNNL